MLGSDSLAARALLEIGPVLAEPSAPPPDVGDIFTRKLEYVNYINMLHTWENNWDRIQLLEICEAMYLDLRELRTALINLLAKLDSDTGVVDSDYTVAVPVRNQSFLR